MSAASVGTGMTPTPPQRRVLRHISSMTAVLYSSLSVEYLDTINAERAQAVLGQSRYPRIVFATSSRWTASLPSMK
jgi:hypothetical protein